jgi:hypothetical protein
MIFVPWCNSPFRLVSRDGSKSRKAARQHAKTLGPTTRNASKHATTLPLPRFSAISPTRLTPVAHSPCRPDNSTHPLHPRPFPPRDRHIPRDTTQTSSIHGVNAAPQSNTRYRFMSSRARMSYRRGNLSTTSEKNMGSSP